MCGRCVVGVLPKHVESPNRPACLPSPPMLLAWSMFCQTGTGATSKGWPTRPKQPRGAKQLLWCILHNRSNRPRDFQDFQGEGRVQPNRRGQRHKGGVDHRFCRPGSVFAVYRRAGPTRAPRPGPGLLGTAPKWKPRPDPPPSPCPTLPPSDSRIIKGDWLLSSTGRSDHNLQFFGFPGIPHPRAFSLCFFSVIKKLGSLETGPKY